ncbi:hypothetical protein [Mesorhizobium sp. NBSH29]|uniref:hypothetical protein n=1 Tax=Mesorhizobium sp. NBSH29 TaxID=2654249 RepID=UPI001896413A|nr:hypothetical protein [Mesorhizobium sp. NBSH29]
MIRFKQNQAPSSKEEARPAVAPAVSVPEAIPEQNQNEPAAAPRKSRKAKTSAPERLL